MARALPISGEYPADWKETSDATWAAAGHRCIRCLHPYRKGEHGKGQWTPCDENCRHGGPLGHMFSGSVVVYSGTLTTAQLVAEKIGCPVVAEWRIGTVHHFDGNKANCAWWNLLALCQRCHLTVQSRVNPQQLFMFEHSDWLKPYVAGFYALKYESRTLTREQVMAELDRLLAFERIV